MEEKKLQKKSEKKQKKKRHRIDKKHSLKDKASCSREEIKVQDPILPQISFVGSVCANEINDAFGPALPPHLLKKEIGKTNQFVIGPVIPDEISENLKHLQTSAAKNISQEMCNTCKLEIDDSLQDSYGPLPVTNKLEMTPTQRELEERALELKMAAIDGISAQTSNQNVREEWMLELPSVGLKGGLAALDNLNRGFHQGKEKPDFSDRSFWTKTPNSGQEKQKPADSKEELAIRAQALYDKQRDAEQEAIAKKHKRKHKCEESLVEIHQRKLRKKEKKKAKQLKETGAKPERRPFTRDVDLKLNKIDRNQTKQIVDKAKILNTKFASGNTKYL